MKRVKALFVLLFTSSILLCACGPKGPHADVRWKLDFEDNFNGTELDRSVWRCYDGPGHNHHGLRKPEAFTVEDGNLVITACMKDSVVVSGGMAHAKGYLPPVKFEFRARCEADSTNCTSGVVLTWPDDDKWPVHGELDIFETLCNRQRHPLHSFLHYGADNSQIHFEYDVDGTEWQEMVLEWYEDEILIYLNGELVGRTDDPDIIPDWHHHICLQLDAFQHKMQDPVHMYVDYVRIYKGKQK